MILYLTQQGVKIKKERRRLQIFLDECLLSEVRLDDLSQIFVFGRVHFTAQALQALLKNEIDVHFLTVSGNYLGRLTSPRGKNVELRLAQFRWFESEEKRLLLSRCFVKGKIDNQRAYLRRQNRKLKDEALSATILQLRQKAKEAETAPDLDTLRGIEGQVAHLYFSVYGKFFQVKGLSFPGRIKRPPPDPVNALLSLGYTLLHSQIVSLLETSGLDPYLGFLHAPDYGRTSLALDLMEEWRPVLVDPLVVRLFNWGTIKPQDFTEEPWDDEEDFTTVRLSPQGLRKFLDQFRKRMDERAFYQPAGKEFTYRDIIKNQIWHLGRVLRGEEECYQSFVFS